jgi:hypothetical protein
LDGLTPSQAAGIARTELPKTEPVNIRAKQRMLGFLAFMN